MEDEKGAEQSAVKNKKLELHPCGQESDLLMPAHARGGNDEKKHYYAVYE
jgi:hypothetical protein